MTPATATSCRIASLRLPAYLQHGITHGTFLAHGRLSGFGGRKLRAECLPQKQGYSSMYQAYAKFVHLLYHVGLRVELY